MRLRRLVVGRPVDVVHIHSPYVAGVGPRSHSHAARGRNGPALVYTEHNRWPRHSRATRWANRLTFPLDDADISVSADVRSTMPPACAGVEVLEHGVVVDEVRAMRSHREAVRAELGIEPDEIVFGTVANFRREKAYEVMLEAAADCAASRPTSRIRFVAVGQGPLEARYERRSHGWGSAIASSCSATARTRRG